MAGVVLYSSMDIGSLHRSISHRKHLDDGSLHDASAESRRDRLARNPPTGVGPRRLEGGTALPQQRFDGRAVGLGRLFE